MQSEGGRVARLAGVWICNGMSHMGHADAIGGRTGGEAGWGVDLQWDVAYGTCGCKSEGGRVVRLAVGWRQGGHREAGR